MSDIQAIGVIEELQERGLRVPEDISVVGFDGTYRNSYFGHRLTTIDQQGYLKGLTAAEMLFSIINGTQSGEKNILIPYSFYEGETLKSI